jgi:hypothetical protein
VHDMPIKYILFKPVDINHPWMFIIFSIKIDKDIVKVRERLNKASNDKNCDG